ncbi:uncharacterized protein ACIBXB_002484 isoform 1-T4 [Morphnus guianensis]
MAFLNGNKASGFVKLLLCIWVTCLILLLQMQRDKLCAKGQWSRSVVLLVKLEVSLMFYMWYPSLNVATCERQRLDGRVAKVKEWEMGIGARRLQFWAVSQHMSLLCFFQVLRASSEGRSCTPVPCRPPLELDEVSWVVSRRSVGLVISCKCNARFLSFGILGATSDDGCSI